ncbi:MAG: MBL fold metallo-hydrolase [Bacteroidota bacterium]
MSRLGIEIPAIKSVILSHLHLDHIDGLKYFSDTPIIVNQLEWDKPDGDLPQLYPQWFVPQKVKLDQPTIQAFSKNHRFDPNG